MPSKRAKELRLQRGSNRLQDGCMDASSPAVQPSVRLSATGPIVIGLGQQTVAVVWRVFMFGDGIAGPIFLPLPTEVVIRVILEVEPHIFLAAAAEQLDMAHTI